jgi:hypothetical protein
MFTCCHSSRCGDEVNLTRRSHENVLLWDVVAISRNEPSCDGLSWVSVLSCTSSFHGRRTTFYSPSGVDRYLLPF